MKRTIFMLLVICLLWPTKAMALPEGWVVMQESNGGTISFTPDAPAIPPPEKHTPPQVEPPETTGKPFEGSKVVGSANGDLVQITDVKGDYKKGSVYGPRLSTKELQQVKAAVIKAINACIREGMTDREKIVALVNYLCNHVSYADDWSKNRANTAWGALCYGEAQCSGYTRALIALLHAVNIDAKHVHASKQAMNPSHQWALLRLDGRWYHIDPQMIDDYMLIDSSTGKITYPRPIVLMSSYMPYETKRLPKTANKNITLQ